jgi:hypothetical protein
MFRIQHIAARQEIRAAFGTGKSVVPLCGKKGFKPKHDGDWAGRICKKCSQLLAIEGVRPYKHADSNSPFTYTITRWDTKPESRNDIPLAG